jgi:hypothetical protein
MSISPATDIVLDVMKAADPARVSLTTRRLQEVGDGARASFSDAVASSAPLGAGQVTPTSRGLLAGISGNSNPARVKLEFESMILGTFISQILPKQGAGLFDHGTGSDMWRSVMGDQIARQIAKSSRIGIADRLFSTHPLASPGTTTSSASAVVS